MNKEEEKALAQIVKDWKRGLEKIGKKELEKREVDKNE